MPRKTSKGGAQQVGVISKVLLILQTIQATPTGLSLKAICDTTGLNKSTAYRFLSHLESEGYLVRTEARTYLLGPQLTLMMTQANRSNTLQSVARPILWDLWKSTQETVNLAILDQGTVLYLDVIDSPHEFRLSSRVGSRRPLHATALGKALAAYLAPEQERVLLDGMPFQSLTPKTVMNLLQFRRELDLARSQGYAVDDEEAVTGARCVAAAVLGTNGRSVAAISISGPVTRVTTAHLPTFGSALTQSSRAISKAMGYVQPEPVPGLANEDRPVQEIAG
jgi:IclR family transcriptional regulator, acetate operon repressor